MTRNTEFLRQSEAGECGLVCLAMVASAYGRHFDLSQLRRRFPLSTRGATAKTLIEVADAIGFHTRPLRAEIEAVRKVGLPAILHWDLNHFVVLTRVSRSRSGVKFTIADPASGKQVMTESELSKHFTGIVIELTPHETFSRADDRIRLKLSQLWSRMHGLGPALTRILALSLIAQIAVLASPFYMQIAIDSALSNGDIDLLTVLAIGFGAVIIINGLSSWLRSRLIVDLSSSLSLQTAINLFRHTIFLPTSWFEKRHLGDVVSRFGSLQPITDLISRGLIGSVVDGVLAITTVCLMWIYSPTLASLALLAVILYAGIKIFFYNTMKMSNANLLAAQAIETSAFIENIRGIATIKSFGQEGNRQRIWQNRKTDVINATLKLGRLNSGFDAANAGLIGLETVVFVYIAVRMAMAGEITVGMVFAFQAYKQNFIGSLTRLIDQVLSYRLLDVHLSRISDIAFERGEDQTETPGDPRSDASIPHVELRNVSFSYGPGLPLILDRVNLEIPKGSSTALVGPSGAGKTTLMKIMCGLLEPLGGHVLVDGIPLHQYGVRKFRGQIGVVSQEDTLFSGSLAENISFFETEDVAERVIQAAKKAAIHSDIMAMPARYETSVGDMGSNLSGGQKQRVLLARALFKNPNMLFLDEGTAHLDLKTEEAVTTAIASLGISRVIVAHRPETLKYAGRIFQIEHGRVLSIPLNTLAGAQSSSDRTSANAKS